jgi:hypothetical protein
MMPWPPPLPHGYLSEVATWLSAAAPEDRGQLADALLEALRDELCVIRQTLNPNTKG